LIAVEKKYNLIDVTIKIYDNLFFFFFMKKPSIKPMDLINTIQKNISCFGSWSKDYLYTSVYDLSEEYIRNFLKESGFDFDNG
jgi:hypothetical protein